MHLWGQERGRLMPWLSRQLDLHPSRAASRRADGGMVLQHLLWGRDDLPVRTPQELGYPLSNCFRMRGVASMRTGWGEEDWLLSHFCGRQEVLRHRQADQNHL